MATDIERLVVSLEAKTAAFDKQLKKSAAQTEKSLKRIEQQFATTNKKLSRGLNLGGMGGGLKSATAGLSGLFAADKIKDYADAWTVAGNKIAAASSVAGRAGRSLSDLNKIATDTRSGITETADLYAKLLRATKDVAKNEQEVATATEVVNKAFKAGGASASEQAAGVLQLSQALSSGILQGDELRSIRENAPLIAQAIANEFKTTIGGLKQLGADGKLTVDRVFKAILDAKPQIDRAYGTTTATIAEGFTLVNNAVTEAIGKINAVTGAGTEVGKTLSDVASIVNALGDTFEAIAATPAGKFLGFLDQVIEKLNPVKQALSGLAEAVKQENLDKVQNIFDPTIETRIKSANMALQRFFDAARAGVRIGSLSANQGKAIEDIRLQLKAGTMDAASAQKAMQDVGKMKPGTEQELSGRFDPLIENIKDLIKVTEEAVKAQAKLDLNTDDRAASREFQQNGKAYGDFISDRDADASRTDLQKEIDTRADKIVEAANKVGIAITEAAAKIQAAKEVAAEGIAKSASASAGDAMGLIKDFEGFRSKAYWDVNHYRVGYGSDTATDASGGVSKVTSGTVVSLAEADRDLLRRIGDTQQGIRDKIGADTFNSFDEKQQAALTSIAYNYGTLPDRLAAAIKTDNQANIVQAIRGLGGDNGGVNRQRRNSEADMFLGGAPSGVQKAVKGQDRFGENLDDTRLQIDLLNKQAEALGLVNPLIEDYGYAQTKAEIAQKLINDAMDNGVEITPELRAKIDELATGYANATAAGNQMAASQSNLQEQMSQSSAFGKDLLGGFIQDLRDGKSASEALAGALDKVADKLLDVALNSLFDGGGIGAKSGGGVLGGLFSWLFPFAKGGIAKNGKPMKTFARGGTSNSAAIFGEAGPEAAVPLPDGRTIPVTLSTPRVPQRQAPANDNMHITVGVSADNNGNLMPFVQSVTRDNIRQAAPSIVGAATKTVRRQMPGLMSEAQTRSL